MRINFSAIICLCITIAFASCGNGNSDTGAPADSTAALIDPNSAQKGLRAAYDFPLNPVEFPHTIETPAAKVTIDNYHYRAIRGTAAILPGSVFHCTASELKAFIAGCGTNVSNLHLFLSDNKSAEADSLHLIVCGVDTNGNHIYGVNGGKLYALRLFPYATKVTTFQTVGTPVISGSGFTRKLTLPNAQRMLDAYNANTGTMNSTATSFLYDANQLGRYIKEAEALSIDHVDFYLAVDYGKLTLVIVGVNTDGKNIYLPGTAGVPEVLEHCIPCPTCENLYNIGTTLERS